MIVLSGRRGAGLTVRLSLSGTTDESRRWLVMFWGTTF